jgi:hypothetical protein
VKLTTIAGETEVLRENLPQRHFVPPQIPHDQVRAQWQAQVLAVLDPIDCRCLTTTFNYLDTRVSNCKMKSRNYVEESGRGPP